jgi:hypothetical protein
VDFRNWLQRIFQLNEVSAGPGWTDDLSVNLRDGRTVEELVDYILVANQQNRQHETLIADLGAEFGLSNDDAELSVDRVCGGIVLALIGNGANGPNHVKDPIAWVSFQRAVVKE